MSPTGVESMTARRAGGRAGERASGRAGERASGRAGERASGRAGERAGALFTVGTNKTVRK